MSSAAPIGSRRFLLRPKEGAPAPARESLDMHMSLSVRDLKPFPRGEPAGLFASIGYTPHQRHHVSMQADHEEHTLRMGESGEMRLRPSTVRYTAETHHIPSVPFHYSRPMTFGLMIAGPELDYMAYCVWEALVARMPPPRTIFTSYARIDLAQPTFFYLFLHRLQQAIMGAVVAPVHGGDFDVNVYEVGQGSDDTAEVIKSMYALEKKHLDNVYRDLI